MLVVDFDKGVAGAFRNRTERCNQEERQEENNVVQRRGNVTYCTFRKFVFL